MTVLLNERFAWQTNTRGSLTVHWRGDAIAVGGVADDLSRLPHAKVDDALTALRRANGHFATIIESPDFLLAGVDHCRSMPVFFARQGPVVSNDARLVKTAAGIEHVDQVSAIEAAMAGYVTGRQTLYAGLSQLQAGDLLWHDKRTGETIVEQYYTYSPARINDAGEAALVDQLAEVTDSVVARVVADADGAPIWVPLSAGLDSRLILCKLVELGYDDLTAFSYGPGGNDEAKAAQVVADRLDVRWQFWPNRRRDMRQLYASADRAGYWAYGDGLCAVPSFQDFPILHWLRTTGEIPERAVVVNGQTGDFISGGHIPRSLWAADAPTLDELFDAIVAKHFSLWNSLKTPANLDAIRLRAFEMLGLRGDERPSREEVAALYERWEYQERQAKHVINGQRSYEYLGLDWALPLWDRRFVDFWRDVPVQHKIGQRLYRRYLDSWNFRGLFKGFSPVVWQWPGATKAVLPLFRFVRLVFGPAARDRLLKRLLYFGLYGYQYAPFGYRQFLRHAENLRNPVSLLSRHWLAERGIPVGVG